MRSFTKAILMLLLCTLGVLTTQAKTEKVHATFENPSNTNTSWNAETKTFTWSTTYYNQLRNIGLPTGDITKYKKLVVDCEIKSGDQFRILFYKGGSNLTLYAKNGVNEFVLADTLKVISPNDYNEYLLACDEICLSGNNAAAPGEAVINDVYLETYDDEGEKVYATFENPSNTNTTWNAETKTFTWSTTYYNQLRNIGLPSGDISVYKKLVVDCNIKSGDQFRILIYKGGSNLTLYAKDGVNEFILADTLKAISPNDYNEYLLACDEICLSGNNAAAPGEAVINAVYLETYPENESVEIPDIVYEEDPGKPEGEFVDFTEVFSTLQPRIGLGTDGHPIVLGNGDVVVGQRTKDVIADLSAYSKLTIVTSPKMKLVLYMNHEVDAQQNAGDYAETDAGKYVFMDVQADENGIIEVDLTQFDKQDLNCICLPWDNNNKGTVWYLLLTAKPTVAEDVLPIDIQFGADFNEKSISNYTSTWTATKDGKTWSLVNFNNNQNKWNSVKCGRKNNESVASITSPAIDAVVKNYVISLAGAANVNSAKLAIMNGEQKVGDDIDITEKFVAGEVNVPVEGQKGYSYVLTIDNASASANGSVEITKVTLYGEGQYVEVEPVHIANTAETAYDVAKAIELIEAGEALTDSVFVKGIISKIDSINAEIGFITYWISADGTEEGQQFECYKGLSMEGLALDAIEVGAEVIVKGTLKKYGDIYELNSGNLLVSYKAPEAPVVDEDLVEIPQSQSPEIEDGATRAAVEEGEGYTQYTTDGGVCVIVKMYDVDVKDCDYVVVKFAEPVSAGVRAAFWAQSSQDNVEIPAGTTEYKYVFAEDEKCAIENGVLPQITLLTLWSAQTVKISGIYKHKKAVQPVEAPATPTFTPAAGEYFAAQTVTIACETEGAAIYYTLDGTAPTAESALYAEPIAIAQTTTVKAIAIKDGVASEVAEAAYTITEPLFADGTYYIYNKGAQKFLAAGSSWGTHAVVNETGLDYIVAFANGKYTLDSQVSNGGNNHFLNGEWNDGAAMGWIFAPVEGKEGVYTISNGTQFLTAGEDGRVTLAADATVETAQWTLTTLEARIAELATATSEAPVNATFLIQDANFGRNDLRKSAWKMEAANQNLSGGEDGNGSVGNNCAESYHSTFALSQVIANAPAGKYKMTAQGFYRQDGSDNDNLPVFYANDKTGTFPLKTGSEGSMTDASKSFTAGNYTIEPIEFTVFEDGQLTIGAKLENNTNLWCIWDNFQLTYVTKDIPADEFEPAYTAALAAAKAAKDNESYAAVTGEEKTALEKAISDYETIAEPSADTYRAAISALTNATTAFTAAKSAYEGLNTTIAQYANLAYPYASAAKKAAAEESTAVTATSAADATAKAEAVVIAYRQYAESNALLEGNKGAKNCTDSIKNPNAENELTGWTLVGKANVKSNEPWTDGEGNSAHKYFDSEQWGDNAWDISLNQKIALSAGKYQLTVKSRASADVEFTLFAGADSVAMPTIGASGGMFNRGWNDTSIEFEMAEADSIVIGVRGVTSVVHNWMSFSDFRLMKFWDSAEQYIPTDVEEPVYAYPASWDFTKWSDATIANLKADAARSKLNGWSDVEKKADAEANVDPTEISKDNCFWHQGATDAYGQLYADGELVQELKGLKFGEKYADARSLAIAVNYPSTSLGEYAGGQYLWLGGGGKSVPCFVLPAVPAGMTITMAVESHKPADARGVELYAGSIDAANKIGESFKPTALDTYTWTIEETADIVVYNTSGCHIYSIKVSVPDDPELVAPEGWTNMIANGNLAGEGVESFFSKEANGATVNSTIVEGAGKNGSRGIVVKSADNPSQAWDTQFWIKLNEALPTGAKLHVEFDYAASKAAKASTQAHGAPGAYQHWAAIGDVNFTTEWKHFSTDITVSSDMATGSGGNGLLSIAFNLAEEKTATEYYFDNFGVWAQLPEPVTEWADIIINGNMEGESMECFYVTEQGFGGPYVAMVTEGIGKDGGKAVKVQSADDPANAWDTQFFIRLPYQLPAGTQYKISFDYKATTAAKSSTQIHAEPGSYIGGAFGDVNFTTDWQSFEKEGTVGSDMQTFVFNLAEDKTAQQYIFDNVKVEVPANIVSSLNLNPAVDPKYYEEVLGIETVKTARKADVIYNLRGQKVNKAEKGLFIINGRKVVK